MKISPEQIADIKKLVRAANRRIERATGGQASYIESYVKRVTGGSEKFSAAYKGLSAAEASKKIEMLERFMSKKETTTKTGWKEFKKESIRKSNAALSEMGYDLTDEELAEILEQIDAGSNEEFYRAINLVTAKKVEEGRSWDPTADKVAEAINQKIDFQGALKAALQANPNIGQRK